MTKKLRPLSDILAALSSFLAIAAALPYELGDVATIIPPEWKARVAVAGAVAACLQRVLRPYLPHPRKETDQDQEPA